VLTICQNIDPAQSTKRVGELSKEPAAIHNGDLTRTEST
jgi:hypothetical protein